MYSFDYDQEPDYEDEENEVDLASLADIKRKQLIEE
jgi:hypothetical protein